MKYENKFGMFIHWGIYSLLGIHEQAQAKADIPHEEYDKLVEVFNPVKFNPKEWVSLAKKAGMKYICFTTKHHDGFCMWDTKYTDYNIMNTPYGKDVLKMLVEECEKQGMLLSLYYSCPDWHHKNGYNPLSSHQWKAIDKTNTDTQPYRDYVKKQIAELMTNYGKIYTLFWDIPPQYEDRSINEIVRQLQPDIIINNRGWDEGDFSTPEREIEETDSTHYPRMLEMCESVGEQAWGYRKNEDYHSIKYLTSTISTIMSMGGNYLLNVGPMANGEISKEAKKVIKKVGNWYMRMQGALEDVEADDFDYQVRRYKYIVNKKNGKSYFNFPEGICSSAVNIKKYPNKPKSVVLLNNGKKLDFDIIPLYHNSETGIAEDKYLHIHNIPVEKYSSEPITIEIQW